MMAHHVDTEREEKWPEENPPVGFHPSEHAWILRLFAEERKKKDKRKERKKEKRKERKKDKGKERKKDKRKERNKDKTKERKKDNRKAMCLLVNKDLGNL